MIFRKNNLNKEIDSIKSDLKEMMLEYQKKKDKEMKSIYAEASSLVQLVVMDDNQILEEVKKNLAKEKEEPDNRKRNIVNLLSGCRKVLTKILR